MWSKQGKSPDNSMNHITVQTIFKIIINWEIVPKLNAQWQWTSVGVLEREPGRPLRVELRALIWEGLVSGKSMVWKQTGTGVKYSWLVDFPH